MKIPEWGRNGFLFDDASAVGRANWAEIERMFTAACKDGTLCVHLVRTYLTQDGQPTEGPCGYEYTEPRADTWVRRDYTVQVVGVCGSEPGETGGESSDTGGPSESESVPTDGPSTLPDTAPAP
ncbi:hypothetical protein [Streptomyces sp. NPDC057302]|uniref:hypothetical protein n=1 Tax=Streptomyces sp. NPDC057302 TaxID=3346094 RepID=UPI00363325C3